MSELSCNVAGVMYKSIHEEDENSCAGCCAAFGQKLCTELKACEGIIWIKAETEMTKEQQKEIKPKTKHVHADMMLEYAKEAMRSDTPWDAFEYKTKEDGDWKQCNRPITWFASIKYRKKPKTININGYEVPEPLREAPAEKSEYYYPNIAFLEVSLDNYDADNYYDNHRLKHGLMHLTMKAAQLHLEALLSFTSEK